MEAQVVVYLIGSGLLLGTSLLIYAHRNFATKEQLRDHRDASEKRDVETKEWLVRIEGKLDTLLQSKK